jgi:hypothetical protein
VLLALLNPQPGGIGSYATRVRSIINDASKNTTTKEILRLKKQITFWKEQAGRMGESEDLEEVMDDRVPKSAVKSEVKLED